MLAKENYLPPLYNGQAGKHLITSPVVGSRSDELKLISDYYSIFEKFNYSIYYSNDMQLIRIIPINLKEKADMVSREIFEDYIEKYKDHGLTLENIVEWNSKEGCISRVEDKRDWFVLACIAPVDDPSHYQEHQFFSINNETYYLPIHLSAIHELMHVEETPKGISSLERNKLRPIIEVLTVTKTIMLVDEVYKRVHDISISDEVDYCKDLYFFGNEGISQGRFANFYRGLEKKYGTLARALVSVESFIFMGYMDKDLPYNYSFFSETSLFRIPGYKDALNILKMHNILTEKNRLVIKDNLPNAKLIACAMWNLDCAGFLCDESIKLITLRPRDAFLIDKVIIYLRNKHVWNKEIIQILSANIHSINEIKELLERLDNLLSPETLEEVLSIDNFGLIVNAVDKFDEFSNELWKLALENRLTGRSILLLLNTINENKAHYETFYEGCSIF